MAFLYSLVRHPSAVPPWSPNANFESTSKTCTAVSSCEPPITPLCNRKPVASLSGIGMYRSRNQEILSADFALLGGSCDSFPRSLQSTTNALKNFRSYPHRESDRAMIAEAGSSSRGSALGHEPARNFSLARQPAPSETKAPDLLSSRIPVESVTGNESGANDLARPAETELARTAQPGAN